MLAANSSKWRLAPGGGGQQLSWTRRVAVRSSRSSPNDMNIPWCWQDLTPKSPHAFIKLLFARPDTRAASGRCCSDVRSHICPRVSLLLPAGRPRSRGQAAQPPSAPSSGCLLIASDFWMPSNRSTIYPAPAMNLYKKYNFKKINEEKG